MNTKTSYGYNEDNFVEENGELKELTVTITLCEYRNLLIECERLVAQNQDLSSQLSALKEQAELMRDMIIYDHPEFYGDMVDAVEKFLAKMKETANENDV